MQSGIMIPIGIIVFLLVLLVCRALVMWWLGINEVIAQQKETNALLKQYLETQRFIDAPASAPLSQRSASLNPLTGR